MTELVNNKLQKRKTERKMAVISYEYYPVTCLKGQWRKKKKKKVTDFLSVTIMSYGLVHAWDASDLMLHGTLTM
jgi:hypothetical protein